jgi:hypothetical protein
LILSSEDWKPAVELISRVDEYVRDKCRIDNDDTSMDVLDWNTTSQTFVLLVLSSDLHLLDYLTNEIQLLVGEGISIPHNQNLLSVDLAIRFQICSPTAPRLKGNKCLPFAAPATSNTNAPSMNSTSGEWETFEIHFKY